MPIRSRIQSRSGWILLASLTVGTGPPTRAGEGVPRQTWRGHAKGVASLAFSPDGSKLASGDRSNSLKVWNVASVMSRKDK